ncbi:hypothetical protein [Yinghuangia soli]|uniref:Uncharacterized protein n=1 Tax=Yinghuangia soli TaxID=2908204 RepID=A0AA41U2F2_9ACTN|nr:hypothetical protein [Yinghuangia soli]MCF2531733.1 hypothetical protein [Yinghuangia soli]
MNNRQAAEANIRDGFARLARIPLGDVRTEVVVAGSSLATAYFTAAIAQGLADVADAIRESSDARPRLVSIAQLADALGDQLPGDGWHLAHAIKRLADGTVTPDEIAAETDG